MIEYTKLSDALAELEKRRHLRPRIEEILAERGIGLPWSKDLGTDKPLAVFFRQVATPNYEVLRFLSIASGFDMQPVILEYAEDKLSMENSYKKSLVCAPVVKKISSKGHVQFEKKWLCNPNEAKPQAKLSSIQSLSGTSLVQTHHEALERVASGYDILRIDGSEWFERSGGFAKDYYEKFFLLFISHALLFESYSLQDSSEISFIAKVVEPAFTKATNLFKVTPLIVPINPTGVEDSTFWVCYPSEAFE